MKKKKQHHVWKSYLRAWATKGKIECLQDGRIFTVSVDDAATQNQFYKLNRLTREDIAYIRKLWIEPSQPDVRPLHEDYLKLFALGPLVRDTLTPEMAENPLLVGMLDEHNVNAEEDHHSRIEADATPILDALRRKDISFYADPSLATSFLHFICVQYFRTVGIKTRTVARLKEAMNIDASRWWNVASHIMATNVTRSLILERPKRPLVLIENETATSFVTGDQPVVNLYSSPDETTPPDHLCMYYPVSPRLAVLMEEPGVTSGYSSGPLTPEKVAALNRRIASASFRQVFGETRSALEGVSGKRADGAGE